MNNHIIMDMEVDDKMVAPEFQLFQAYRQKAAALRSATQDTLEIFSNIGSFSSANEYLLKRAGISNRLQDRLKRGDKQIKPLLQSLIKELNAEIKELDSMLSSISVFGGDVFKNFQQSAISHQKIQSDILSELYELGIDYLHAIDDQIHARTTSVEQAHHRFREKLQEILIAITNKSDKAVFIDTWIDCMEFLILYIRDDMELALPRHTYIELIEQESYGPAKTVLSKYFTSGAGEHYISKFEKAGIKRRVREDDRNKDKYVNLDADKQKEVDEVVKDSLLKLLEGVEFEHPNNRQRFTWDQIKEIIEKEIFKGEETKKLTDEYKEQVDEMIKKLREAINSAGLSFKRFGGNSVKGFDGLKFVKRRGRDITLSKVLKTDGDGLFQEKNFNELDYIMQSIEVMLRGNKPHENNNEFKQFLFNNRDLFEQDISNPNSNAPGNGLGGPSQNEQVLKQRMRFVYGNMINLSRILGGGIQATSIGTLQNDWTQFSNLNVSQIESEIQAIFSGLVGNDISQISVNQNIHRCAYFEEFAKYFNYRIQHNSNGYTHQINDFLLFCKNNWNDFENPSQNLISNNLLGEFFTKLFLVIPDSLFIQNP